MNFHFVIFWVGQDVRVVLRMLASGLGYYRDAHCANWLLQIELALLLSIETADLIERRRFQKDIHHLLMFSSIPYTLRVSDLLELFENFPTTASPVKYGLRRDPTSSYILPSTYRDGRNPDRPKINARIDWSRINHNSKHPTMYIKYGDSSGAMARQPAIIEGTNTSVTWNSLCVINVQNLKVFQNTRLYCE